MTCDPEQVKKQLEKLAQHFQHLVLLSAASILHWGLENGINIYLVSAEIF